MYVEFLSIGWAHSNHFNRFPSSPREQSFKFLTLLLVHQFVYSTAHADQWTCPIHSKKCQSTLHIVISIDLYRFFCSCRNKNAFLLCITVKMFKNPCYRRWGRVVGYLWFLQRPAGPPVAQWKLPLSQDNHQISLVYVFFFKDTKMILHSMYQSPSWILICKAVRSQILGTGCLY